MHPPNLNCRPAAAGGHQPLENVMVGVNQTRRAVFTVRWVTNSVKMSLLRLCVSATGSGAPLWYNLTELEH
jgi:hypothetical protein